MNEFESRKASHIEWALSPASQTSHAAEWARVRLAHCAVPELDFADVELTTPFLNKKLATPFFVSGMTAGHSGANEINLRLADACAKRGWILGVGSQRRELEQADDQTDVWEKLRAGHPKLAIVGNLGASQLIETSPARIRELLKRLSPDALAIHLNPLQEALQPEGTPQFEGLIKKLIALRKSAPRVSLVIKETGSGLSRAALKKLARIPGLLAIDTSGLGGTHWGRIEGFRAQEKGDAVRAVAAQAFADWGVSTVESVMNARAVFGAKKTEIWGSGGVRNGVDAAKLIALGAHRVGFARGALEAAQAGAENLELWMETREYELRTALFCTGYSTPTELRQQALKKRDVTYT